MTNQKTSAKLIKFDCDGSISLSAIVMNPPKARACFVFAHGAGAGMSHSFMEQVAANLYAAGVATFRFQFPYMEAGKRRPDSPATAGSAVRAAVAEARRHNRNIPIFAGGKSFGGRMTSQAQAEASMRGVKGIAIIGFPLHPSGKPSIARADHLATIKSPLLFIQGTRDKLADPRLLQAVLRGLGPTATVHLIDQADHAFHIPKRTGRDDSEILAEVCRTLTRWIARLT
jgi:predicted alpha/beta-hydrolase family hydrolase